jgi:hypothetical protein
MPPSRSQRHNRTEINIVNNAELRANERAACPGLYTRSKA